MIMQLNDKEVREAVTEWLARRGAIITDDVTVEMLAVDRSGTHLNIVGTTIVVKVRGVELPPQDGPYR